MSRKSGMNFLLIVAAVVALGLFVNCILPPQSAANPHLPMDAAADVAMVASAHPLASQAGVEILRRGGSAVDAAVAVALVLNVVEPQASGIGGGGFMLIRSADGAMEMIDFRERAPAATTPDLFYCEGELNQVWVNHGGRSVAVPGAVAGFDLATRRHGKLKWATLFEPAIRYATEGFAITENLAGFISSASETLRRYSATAAVFLPEGFPAKPGQILKNPALAATLRRIAQEGPSAFYQGDVARAIVNAVASDGGVMTLEDLTGYKPSMRTPVRG